MHIMLPLKIFHQSQEVAPWLLPMQLHQQWGAAELLGHKWGYLAGG